MGDDVAMSDPAPFGTDAPGTMNDAGTDAATHPPAPGNVTVIEVETRKVVKVLELGPNVTGMGRAQDS